ncbi:bifunctional DNA-binding transcriptional regulator/O6-methylguanine-DNA methyltransferase Ada [Falsochrobactrum shanghaiense]|uniref:Regulatory protein of adaptive response n=1 Tax=Falsochrobactrum shanghaiense TaxID=2201899 RepID=A0A316JEU1_9HYPH|nr:bifunctional DNA-binding transcriptional regulator/O6-methylguanine-DNA methyltransferase Ada [Falsochrobactrum shanghaiense]PWL19169.1 bifunctional DNA-binding transcriptional regulator/O6-methylguanine-DNA methyltransferase Ada [Falsochrobactrum shanghaiense]
MNLMTTHKHELGHDLDESRWQKVLARDHASDGEFVYAVRTTGVYCRPSCPSRRGKRENVQFFQCVEEARRAGFRPCMRCHPDLNSTLAAQNNARHADMVASACRFIEAAQEIPALEEIASALNTSPAHLHRIFKGLTGLTPKAYADAHRAGKMRAALKTPQTSVTEAIYDAGYNSSSRFYEASDKILGMKPKAYKSGGDNETIRFAIGQSSLGAVLVAQSDHGVCAILMGDEPEELIRDLEKRFPKAELVGADRDFEDHIAQVIGFVENPRIGLDLPLDLRGTAFQQRVWQALREIPAGETLSYSELAQKLGLPKSTRAVAGACAANKIAIAVPCHRVVRNDGGLSGYRWGVERKRDLLERERKS